MSTQRLYVRAKYFARSSDTKVTKRVDNPARNSRRGQIVMTTVYPYGNKETSAHDVCRACGSARS